MNYLKYIGLTTILILTFSKVVFSQENNNSTELKDKFDYYFYAALNEKAKNNYAESFDLLQHCLTLDSTNANVLIELAAFYTSLGEMEKGLDLVNKSLKYDPDNYYYNMISAGLFEEAASLQGRYSRDNTAAQGIGYRETGYYFRGLTTLDETIRLIKRNTRHLAKRQMTWFGRNPDIIWIDALDEKKCTKKIFERWSIKGADGN